MTGVWNRTSRWVLAAACVLGAVGAGRGLAQSGGGGTPSPDRAALADQEYASAEAAARQNPRDAVLAVEAGGIAGDRGRHLLALTWFQKAEKLNPRLAPAITGQGQMWMALGWPGRAVAAYDRALKLAPEEPQLLLEMSRACAAQRDLDRALELAKKAQTLLPGDAHTARALAHIHAERNEMDLSLVAAQKACDLAPQDDANWTTWGQLLFRANKPAEAAISLRRALALDPAEAAPNLTLARALTAAKKTAETDREAFALLSRVRMLDPEDPAALLLQGEIALRAGNLPLALTLLRQAREATPRDPVVLRTLGQALVRMGKMEEGLRLSTKSQDLGPRGTVFSDLEQDAREDRDSRSTLVLAEVYRRQEQYDAAEFVLRRRMTQSPGDPKVRQKLAQVMQEARALLPAGQGE